MKLFNLLIICYLLSIYSCNKEKNELDRTLYNPYDELTRVDNIFIDSGNVTIYPGTNVIKVYFHLDYSKFSDTSQINRVNYTINDIHESYLVRGNYSYILYYDHTSSTSFKVQANVLMNGGVQSKPSQKIILYP